MDDFKTSTRAMLEVVRGEKARLKQRMDELDEREKTILKWIEAEEGPQPELPMSAGRPLIPTRVAKPKLQEFFRDVMREGRALTNADLADMAKMRGLVPEDVDLRSIHSTMMSLMNAGLVVRNPENKWVRKVGK